MKAITKAQLLETIRNHKGATFATVTTNTDAKLKKTGNPYKDVRKVSTMNVCVGFNYETCVNKNRTREDMEADFVAAPRKWGQRVDSKTVEHNGNIYLSMSVQKTFDVKYMAGDLEIQKDSIKAFIPEQSHSETQGTDKEIIYRDVDISNIKAITMFGETFIVN